MGKIIVMERTMALMTVGLSQGELVDFLDKYDEVEVTEDFNYFILKE